MSNNTPQCKNNRKFYKTTGAGILTASLLVPLGFAAFASPTSAVSPDTGPAWGSTQVDIDMPSSFSPNFVDVESGHGVTFAVDSDGKRYAWGQDSGELGLGRSDMRSGSPRLPEALPAGVTSWTLGSVQQGTGVAIGDDGNAYSWGDNEYNQLGTGDNIDRNTPTLMQLPAGVTAVDAGAGTGYVMVVGSDGVIYGWGLNDRGQLGNGTTTSSSSRVAVSAPGGLTFTKVSPSHQSVVALASDGSAYTWGYRNTGSMGTVSPNKPLLSPNRVNTAGGVVFTSVFNGGESGYGVTADNVVYHWGRDLTQSTGSVAPSVLAPPAGVSFKQIEATHLSIVALSTTGKVYTIGSGSFGVLGNGATTDSFGTWVSPTLPASETFVDVSIGGNGTALAVTSNGDIYSWGYNSSGSLGSGATYGDRHTPDLVVQPEVQVISASFGGVIGSENAMTSPSKPGKFTVSTPEYPIGGPVDVNVLWKLGGLRQADIVHEDAFTYAAPTATPSAPSIYSQPETEETDKGEAFFSVGVSGFPKPTVQWQESSDGGSTWNDILGAKRTSLSLSKPSTANTYRAVVSNSEGSVISDEVAYVESNVASSAPGNDGLSFGTPYTIAGQSVVLDASEYVSNPGSSTISWEVSTNAGSTWSAVLGADTPVLTVSNPTLAQNGHRYRITITNSLGTAVLTGGIGVYATGSVPSSTGNVEDVAVFENNQARFSVSASGTPSPAIQWQVSEDNGTTWENLTGETKRYLKIDQTDISMDGNLYRTVLTNSVGTHYTSPGKMTVISRGTPPSIVVSAPTINTDLVDVSVSAGGDATFIVSADGNPAPTYLWSESTDDGATWNPLVGEDGNTFTISDVEIGNSGNLYRVEVSNSAGSVFSRTATLTVSENAPESEPVITDEEWSSQVVEGHDAQFTVSVTGSPAPTIEWQESVDGSTWTTIAGETSPTLTVPAVELSDSGKQYRAVVSNSEGTATSSVMTLTVIEVADVVAPEFTQQPVETITIPVNGSGTLTVEVAGNPAPAIQWQVSTDDGANWSDITGETSNSLQLDEVIRSMDGMKFRAVATNAQGTVFSSETTLEVPSQNIAPVILTSPANASVKAGEDAIFSVEAENGANLTYQWQSSVNGDTWTDLPGATSQTLVVEKASTDISGTMYRVIVSNESESTISASAVLTVAPADNGGNNNGGTDTDDKDKTDPNGKPADTKSTSSDMTGMLLAAGGGLLLLGGAVTAGAVTRRKNA